MKRYSFLIFFLLILHLNGREIVFGVVPQQSPLELMNTWQPIIEHIKKQTGLNVVFKTERSITKFEEVLYRGGYDLAFMSPYHYIQVHESMNYEARLRANKDLVGILVAKKGVTLDSWNSKSQFLFPAPFAFAATMLIQYELTVQKGIEFTLSNTKYVNSHDSVYKGVDRGFGMFGGGVERTFNSLNDPHAKEHLDVIYTTKAYPSHPIGMRSTLNRSEQKAITNALLTLPDSLLEPLSIKSFIPITDHEYDSVRVLMKPLKATIEP